MRAISYDTFGPASQVLALSSIVTPTVRADEVLVRLKRSGVNPSDVKARAGSRPGVTKPPFPQIIPHSDGAGVIEAVGANVPTARIGERVWIWNGQWQRAFGTAAEFIVVPAIQAVPLPDHVSFAWGATLGIPGLTAVHAVLSGGPVTDRTVLVSGGAGVVGHLAVQIAVASGARVLATAGDQAGMDAAKAAGAVDVFDYKTDDLADQILSATNGAPVDRIVEVEFGKNATTNAQVIAERGTIACYGSAKDMTPSLPFYPLMFKAVTLDLMLIYILSTAERSVAIAQLTDLLNRNLLDIRIAETFGLQDCAEAHEAVENGKRAGSVVLEI